ncbi:MAG TPA: GNAT family N-acetyltransferase [Neobacillus sp.]|jgi:hypothetical protein
MTAFEIIDNRNRWISILRNFNPIDCYYSFEYGKSFARKEDGELFAAYFENGKTKIFYPFIKRQVPFVKEEIFDIVTPYGYGGPHIVWADEDSVLLFNELFGHYCKTNRIITETIRFHPLYGNQKFFKNLFDVEYIRQTTAVDLTLALEEIRNHYTSMTKRNIKTARKNNLTCVVAEGNKDNIHSFMDLYYETMKRLHATNYYYFDEEFFLEQVKDTDISNTHLLVTKMNNEIIAAVMVLTGQEFSHYHLGASRTNSLALRPNNLLFDFMIEFCQSKGSKMLHLGGGYRDNDGLFTFKTSFTNQNHFPYYIGKKVHDALEYSRIIDRLTKEFQVNESYFPIYRGQLHRKQLQS